MLSGGWIKTVAALALSLSSCSGLSLEQGDGEPVMVSFVISQPMTKSTSADQEIRSVDILLFIKESGRIDAVRRCGSDSISMLVPTGVDVDYHLVANAPQGSLDSISNEADFLSRLTSLQENAGGNHLMAGSGSAVFSKTDRRVRVDLRRYLCKVTLESLSVESGFAGRHDIRLEEAFLINVNGTEPMSGTPSAGEIWYNRSEKDEQTPEEVRTMLVHAGDSAQVGVGPSRLDWTFFCMPNPVLPEDDHTVITDSLWCPRCTRLVIRMSVDSETNYYAITLPPSESNTNLLIKSAVITGMGTPLPDMTLGEMKVTWDVCVDGWEEDSNDIDFNQSNYNRL